MATSSRLFNESLFAHCEETLAYLLEKLEFIKLKPKTMLVIGCSALKEKTVITLKALYPEVQCDFLFQSMRDYPVKADHYDLILGHWLQPTDLLPEDLTDNALSTYELLFYLLHVFLKPNGLLLFSYLGPETTLSGLNTVLAHTQPPMQVLGDALLKLGYQDPVLDRDRLCYKEGCLELAYGHAWKKPETEHYFSKPDEEGTVFMPISQIQHLEVAESSDD